MAPIDYQSPALGPVRECITARVEKLTEIVINASTPLDKVPGHRGEIAALKWLLVQLDKPREIHE